MAACRPAHDRSCPPPRPAPPGPAPPHPRCPGWPGVGGSGVGRCLDLRVRRRQQDRPARRGRRRFRLGGTSQRWLRRGEPRGLVADRRPGQPGQMGLPGGGDRAEGLPGRVRFGQEPRGRRRRVAHQLQARCGRRLPRLVPTGRRCGAPLRSVPGAVPGQALRHPAVGRHDQSGGPGRAAPLLRADQPGAGQRQLDGTRLRRWKLAGRHQRRRLRVDRARLVLQDLFLEPEHPEPRASRGGHRQPRAPIRRAGNQPPGGQLQQLLGRRPLHRGKPAVVPGGRGSRLVRGRGHRRARHPRGRHVDILLQQRRWLLAADPPARGRLHHRAQLPQPARDRRLARQLRLPERRPLRDPCRPVREQRWLGGRSLRPARLRQFVGRHVQAHRRHRQRRAGREFGTGRRGHDRLSRARRGRREGGDARRHAAPIVLLRPLRLHQSRRVGVADDAGALRRRVRGLPQRHRSRAPQRRRRHADPHQHRHRRPPRPAGDHPRAHRPHAMARATRRRHQHPRRPRPEPVAGRRGFPAQGRTGRIHGDRRRGGILRDGDARRLQHRRCLQPGRAGGRQRRARVLRQRPNRHAGHRHSRCHHPLHLRWLDAVARPGCQRHLHRATHHRQDHHPPLCRVQDRIRRQRGRHPDLPLPRRRARPVARRGGARHHQPGGRRRRDDGVADRPRQRPGARLRHGPGHRQRPGVGRHPRRRPQGDPQLLARHRPPPPPRPRHRDLRQSQRRPGPVGTPVFARIDPPRRFARLPDQLRRPHPRRLLPLCRQPEARVPLLLPQRLRLGEA